MGGIACVDTENPCLRGPVSNLVRVGLKERLLKVGRLKNHYVVEGVKSFSLIDKATHE